MPKSTRNQPDLPRKQSTDGPFGWTLPCEVYPLLADKGTALSLYMALVTHADKQDATCYPSEVGLADTLKVKPLTIVRNLKILIDAGFVIKTQRCKVVGNKRLTRNRYFLPQLKTALANMREQRIKNDSIKNDSITNDSITNDTGDSIKNDKTTVSKKIPELKHRTKTTTKDDFSIRTDIEPLSARRGKR